MALQALLKDGGFQIPSQSAKEAHLAASEMLEWLATPDNAALAAPVSQEITAAISKCIPHHPEPSVRECGESFTIPGRLQCSRSRGFV